MRAERGMPAAGTQGLKARAWSSFERASRASLQTWGGAVMLVAAGLRVVLWAYYGPVPYNDTPAYWRMASAIQGGWDIYDGTRTPGYPLLLAVLRRDDNVYLAQLLMGLAVTFFVFWIAWMLTRQAWFAGLAGLAHTLNLGQLLFEPNLLSETATTFWLALTFAGVFLWLYRPDQRRPGLALVLALTASMAWLTRPLFVFLPAWLFLFLAWSEFRRPSSQDVKDGRRMPGRWVRLAAFTVPAVLVIGGWTSFIHLRFGDWSLTTMTGYHMVQHTGSYFEYVPDQYAGLRDTYLKYRQEQIERHGNQTNTIWAAIPEMQQVTGASFYELSRLLARISFQLIREHPLLYLQTAAKGWWYFWRAPVYWSPEAVAWPALRNLIGSVVLLERLALIGANLVFVATSLLAFASRRLREAWQISPALWCLAGTIWAASVVQTLADHGDNPRFLIPLQSFVVLWVFWMLWQMLRTQNLLEGKLKQ